MLHFCQNLRHFARELHDFIVLRVSVPVEQGENISVARDSLDRLEVCCCSNSVSQIAVA